MGAPKSVYDMTLIYLQRLMVSMW